MIPLIGSLVVAYAVTRLIQVPIEHRPTATPEEAKAKQQSLSGVSVIGVAIILILAALLWNSQGMVEPRVGLPR